MKTMRKMATEKWSQILLETSGTLLKVNTWFDLALLNAFEV